MEQQIDPIIQSAIDAGKVAGVAAVVLDKSGKKLLSKGWGYRDAGDPSSGAVTPQTPAMIWSCTKLVTCVAGLQLVEQGKLNLNDPVEKYAPEMKNIKRLKGWNDDGSPKLEEQTNPPKVVNLFTHTSGFSYDFFNKDCFDWRINQNQPPCAYVTRSAKEEYTPPLVFEPGERWEYGCNQEWIGFIIDKISGMPLAEYVEKNIAQPLGLKVFGRALTPEQDKEFLTIHAKDDEGKLTPTPMKMAPDPEVVPGGHYLYASTEDYAEFLLALLNEGTSPTTGAQILKPETVKNYLFKDMLPELGTPEAGCGDVPSTMPPVTRTGAFLPGVSRGWSLGGLINNDPLPNGRNKNSLAWAGLGNCYFWVDPAAEKLGFLVSATLPFFDEDVLHLADAMERAVYGKPAATKAGEKGSNFTGGAPLERADSHQGS